MAIVNNPAVMDERARNAWALELTFSNNEIDDRVVTIENTYISISELQSVVAASSDFADFQARIAALTSNGG